MANGGKELTPIFMARKVVPQKRDTAQKAIQAMVFGEKFKL